MKRGTKAWYDRMTVEICYTMAEAWLENHTAYIIAKGYDKRERYSIYTYPMSKYIEWKKKIKEMFPVKIKFVAKTESFVLALKRISKQVQTLKKVKC